MKNSNIIMLLCIGLLASSIVLAQDRQDKETPPWMEDVKVKGRSTYQVPKGAKRKIIGAQMIVESPNEYVARRIYEMEKFLQEYLDKIEEDQKKMKVEIEQIKKILEEAEEKENHAAADVTE